MRTSLTGDTPKPPEHITDGAVARVCARNRQHVYDLLTGAFEKSGLSQAELARRAGMAPEVISRLFKRPRNIEIDTASILLFCMTGATITLAEEYPRSAGARADAFQVRSATTAAQTEFRPARASALAAA